MTKGQLAGKRVVIVGGSGAIGLSLARGLLGEGVELALIDRSDEVTAVAKDLSAGSATQVLAYRADVGDEFEVTNVFAGITEVWGSAFALIHAAGIYPRRPVLDLTPSEWDQTQTANLRSFFLCTQAALKLMMPRGEGRVIGLASGLAVVGKPGSSAYAASKAGLMGFVRAVASELGGSGITINCIGPGITESPMMRGANTDEEVQASVARTGRAVAEPAEMLAPVLFLLGDQARSVSGTTMWLRHPT